MKKFLLFFLVSCIPFYLVAQPLACDITISGISYSTWDMCLGEDQILTGVGSGGTSPYTYSWAGGSGQLSPLVGATPTFTASSVGTYTVTCTATDGASNTATATIAITVHALPTLFTTSNKIICLGDCINLTAITSTGDGLIWYQDFIGGTVLASGGTNLQINVCPNVTTDYYAMSYVAATGCVKSKKVTVTVINLTASTTASINPICLGDTTCLNATPGGGIGPYTYAWSPNTWITNTGIKNPCVYPPTNTTYIVTITDQTSHCSATSSVTITVNPQQPPTIKNDTTICYGGCATLTATGSGNIWQWASPPGGVNPTVVVCPTTTTIYTVTMTDAAGCTASDNAVVTVNPQLFALAGPDQFVCFGNCVTIGQLPNPASGGSAPYSYTWSSVPASVIPAGSNPSVCPTVTTTYTLTVTDAAGCTATDAAIVTVNPKIVINAPNPPPICAGNCVTLGNIPNVVTGGTPPYTFNWSPAVGLSCTNCPNPSACPPSTTSYTISVTDAAGCTASQMVTVTVNSKPVFDAGNPQTTCSNQCVTIGGAPASGGTAQYTYAWSSVPVSVIPATPSPSVCPTVTTTYTVTVTDANGCSVTDNVTITVNPAPTANAGLPQTLCTGQCVPVGGSPTASGGTAPYTYNWSPNGTLSSGSIANPTACPLSTTTYNLTVTDALGCTASSSVTITVNTATATATANPATICQGACTNITATGGGTYSWSSPPGGSIATINVCPAATTTYTVTVTAANGCTATASATVTVLPVSVTATPTTNPICAGQCTDITAAGAGTFQWSSPPGGTNATINVCPAATTTYTVTITAANGCTASASSTIIVNTATVSATATPPSVCQGSCSSITATGSGLGGSYAWSNPPGGNAATINVCPAATTTYTVTFTASNGCTATTTATVTVNTATATASPATICLGQCATIAANGGVTYLWSTGATTPTINVCPVTTTQYCVTVTDAQGCTASACATVTVNVVNATATAAPASICLGGSSTLTATGGGTYSWSTGGTTASIIVSPVVTTTYTVTVTNSGCTGTASVTVTVNTLSITEIPTQNPICVGQCTNITATGGGTYQWSSPPGGTTNTINVCPAATTTYSVTVTNGCTASASVTITVNSATANISAAPATVCAGSPSVLTATGGGTYNWSTGQTTAQITVNPLVATNYCVTVTSVNGCTATACTTVNVTPLPNAVINPSSANICTGTSATITASGGGTYQWSSPPGGTTASISVSPASTTTYSVTVTNGGCSASTTAIVNVVTAPVASLATTANPLCQGQSTTITASGGTNYQWSNPPGGTTAAITVTPAATTTYTVTVTSTGCTAASTSSVTITVNPVPVATATASPNPICNGGSTTLTSGGGTVYQWSNPPGGSSPIVIVAPSSTTNYTVTVSNTFGCLATAGVTVTVNTVNATATATPPAICQGQITSLCASGGGTYQWSNGSTTNCITVSPSSTSTYVVTVTAINGCTATANVTVIVNAVPAALITPASDSVCAGSSSTLTASGGGTYSWSTGSAAAAITVSPAVTSTYTVTVTGGNGCSSSVAATIHVTPIPSVGLTSSDADNTICFGDCVTFTANGATLYEWFINGASQGPPSGVNIFTSCSLNNNDAVSVNGSTNGCPDSSPIINMTVHPKPVITITSVNLPSVCGVCDGSITEATSGGTLPYSAPVWSSMQNTPTITNLCAGLYSVTVTDAFGCSDNATVPLADPNAPNITLTSNDADNTICQGDCPIFTGNGGVSYDFYINGTLVQSGAITSYMACTLVNGDSVYVQGTDAFGCLGFSNIIHMTVNPLPLQLTVTGGGQFCQGNPGVPVGVNGSQVGVVYLLYNGGYTGQFVYGTGSNISFGNQLVSGTYTVMAQDTATGCTNTMIGSAIITQNPLPTQFTVTGGGTFCSGGAGILVCLNGSQIGVMYQLLINGFPDTTVAGTGAAICFGNQTSTGTYCVTATNTLTTCSVSMLNCINITASPIPTAYSVTGGGNYCTGGIGVLVGISGSDLGVNYQVIGPAGPLLPWYPGTGSAIDFNYFTAAGVYTVVAQNAALCSNTMTGSVTINVNPLPTANAGPDATICQWSSTTLNGSGAGVGGTYQWAPITWLSNDSIFNPIATPQTTMTYFLTVTDINGCSASDNVVITVNPFTLPVIAATDTGFCTGITVNSALSVIPGPPAYTTYNWSTAETTSSIVVGTVGCYTVTVTAANGCSAASPAKCIQMYPVMPPAVILENGPKHFCQPDSVMLYLNNPYYTFEWSSGSINVPSIFVTETGYYSVTVTDSFGCVYHAGPDTVIVDPLPHAIISYVDRNDTLTFDFYSYSLYGSTYSWVFGDPSSGALNTTLNPDYYHEFSAPGTYTVTLTVSNNCGTDVATANIVVHPSTNGIGGSPGISDISLYPNPTKDLLNIDFTLLTNQHVTLTMFDALSRQMYIESFDVGIGKYHKELDMSDIPKGIYFFRIASDDGIYIEKVIKN